MAMHGTFQFMDTFSSVLDRWILEANDRELWLTLGW